MKKGPARERHHTNLMDISQDLIDIEQKYKHSVANKIYVFPKKAVDDPDTLQNSLQQIDYYDLFSQNYQKVPLQIIRPKSRDKMLAPIRKSKSRTQTSQARISTKMLSKQRQSKKILKPKNKQEVNTARLLGDRSILVSARQQDQQNQVPRLRLKPSNKSDRIKTEPVERPNSKAKAWRF